MDENDDEWGGKNAEEEDVLIWNTTAPPAFSTVFPHFTDPSHLDAPYGSSLGRWLTRTWSQYTDYALF
ncbi:hypothetical protein Hypma_012546 [Hypsizygus marmoreus]|uniref:Uncharacterized protein n=1 Tax=Hypsizygus marmoreus TaxID=39966 RepID=A0A369JJ23_HYPMA|nr:hypothetical protein Hypma_012546 [Hypsizygus marmoreus]